MLVVGFGTRLVRLAGPSRCSFWFVLLWLVVHQKLHLCGQSFRCVTSQEGSRLFWGLPPAKGPPTTPCVFLLYSLGQSALPPPYRFAGHIHIESFSSWNLGHMQCIMETSTRRGTGDPCKSILLDGPAYSETRLAPTFLDPNRPYYFGTLLSPPRILAPCSNPRFTDLNGPS